MCYVGSWEEGMLYWVQIAQRSSCVQSTLCWMLRGENVIQSPNRTEVKSCVESLWYKYKAGYTLIVSHVSTCLYTISWDCHQSLYTSHNIADFVHLWFCEKLDEKLSLFSLWHFVKIPTVGRERRNARWEKWLVRWFTKCYPYTYRFSYFANIFSRSRQFDDKCIAGFEGFSPRTTFLMNFIGKQLGLRYIWNNHSHQDQKFWNNQIIFKQTTFLSFEIELSIF